MVINPEHAGFFESYQPLTKSTNFTFWKVFALEIFARGRIS